MHREPTKTFTMVHSFIHGKTEKKQVEKNTQADKGLNRNVSPPPPTSHLLCRRLTASGSFVKTF